MKETYSIKGTGRGFDGLLVESTELEAAQGRLVNISKITNRNAIFGDRNISFPLPRAALYIDRQYLEPFDASPQEFDSKNPNGKYMNECRIKRHTLEVVCVEYERALVVTVLEHEKQSGKYNDTEDWDIVHTRFSQNFYCDFDNVRKMIGEEIKKDDLDDLVFLLQQTKAEELS